MNKVFLIVISLIAIFIFSNFIFKITGMVIGNADVSIKDNLQGRITALNYRPVINITDIQNITTEFTNIGSLPLTAKIEETIYFYNSTKLDPVAYYYDSSVQLMPGMKRIYKTVFAPPYYGTYYIKVRVPYDTKVTELWGVFSVVYYIPPPPPIIIVVPPTGEGGPITYITKEAGTPKLTAEYQKSYDLHPGQSILISINAKNTGEVHLFDLRLSTSTTSLIETEVNPKVLSTLKPNASALFLVSLTIPKDIPVGVYPLNFEIMSDKIMEAGMISLNITSYEVSIKDEVYQTILNYDYLANELEKKISDAISEGLDITIAQRSFEKAKTNLQRAKDYYSSGDYESARDKLDEVKKDFEDVVFQLAHAELKLYVAPAFSPFIIVILAIILAVIILFYLRIKKKGKRPKLLREISEET
jgi:hypothetical protein